MIFNVSLTQLRGGKKSFDSKQAHSVAATAWRATSNRDIINMIA